jgi:hypothetical protein
MGVRTELNGAMAYKLAKAFGVIPSPEKNVLLEKPNDFMGVDPQTLAKAKVLGQVAMERGASRQPDTDELEKLVHKEPVESNRKSSRLFANRD